MGNTLIKDLENSRKILKTSTQSMGQSMTVLNNATIKLIGTFDQWEGGSYAVADATQFLVDKMDALAVIISSGLIDKLLAAQFGLLGEDIRASAKIIEDTYSTLPKGLVTSFGNFADSLGTVMSNYVNSVRTLVKLGLTEIFLFVDKTIDAFSGIGAAIANVAAGNDYVDEGGFDAKWAERRRVALGAITDEYDASVAKNQAVLDQIDLEIAAYKRKREAMLDGKGTGKEIDLIPVEQGLTPEEQAEVDKYAGKLNAKLNLQENHLLLMEQVRTGYKTQEQANDIMWGESELVKLSEEQAKIRSKLTEHQQEVLNLDEIFAKRRKQVMEEYGKKTAKTQQTLDKQRVQQGFQAMAMLGQLNQKSQGLQRISIIGSTASAVMSSYENGGGYPWGLIPAGIMAAVGAKQLSQVGKSSGVDSGGSGGGAPAPISPGLNSSSLSSSPLITTESDVATELLNELRNRDPNELLPVDYVRRMFASFTESQRNGTA